MSGNILQEALETGLWDPSHSIHLVVLINLGAESARDALSVEFEAFLGSDRTPRCWTTFPKCR